MIDTYLVQRLLPPPKTGMHDKIEHVFGGASKIDMGTEGFKALREVFTFDLMGAAEYEFGTVPKTLKALAEDSAKLQAFTVIIPAAAIEPNWDRGRPKRTARGKVAKKQPVHPPVTDRTVYVLAREQHRVSIPDKLRLLAGNKVRTKMGTSFPRALDPISEHDGRVVGWLELDNGFFFFLDQAMWRKTAALFTGKDPGPQEAP